MNQLVGAIEAGGTKFLCAVGTSPDDVRVIERIPTTTPAETLRNVVAFLLAQQAKLGPLQSVGIGSFGPVDPNRASPTFGYITSTPKPGWQNTDVVGPIQRALGIPVAFDTDVNAAALGEWQWGAARGLDCFIYLTVGTGIGGGGVIHGHLMHGLIHPEMGHLRVPHDRQVDPYDGHCPFHGDCLEGLASGPAIAERWGTPAEKLAEDHPAWNLEATYLALALVNFICTLSPQRIILGGGVVQQSRLYVLVRTKVADLLNGYIQAPSVLESIEDYITAPGLGDRAGILGALALGDRLLAS